VKLKGLPNGESETAMGKRILSLAPAIRSPNRSAYRFVNRRLSTYEITEARMGETQNRNDQQAAREASETIVVHFY